MYSPAYMVYVPKSKESQPRDNYEYEPKAKYVSFRIFLKKI